MKNADYYQMTTECSICAEKFNKSFRRRVNCSYCEKECCSDCFGNFLITSGFEPSCMFCKKNITTDFVIDNLTKKFCNTYSNHRNDIVFSREKSLLPGTQVIVNNLIKINDTKKYSKELQQNKKDLQTQIVNLTAKYKLLQKKDKVERDKLKTEIKNLRTQKKETQDLIRESYVLLCNLENRKDVETEEKPKFIMKCPDEDCKGFLCSSYKCGTCSNYFCPDCHIKKNERNDESHVCDEDTKATVSLLKLDTKSCPKCMTPIYKVSGCDQMWCLTCKTAFSWNTGKIDNGYVHNPEYFRYMRENNLNIERNPLDLQGENRCAVMPQYYRLILNQSASDQRKITEWYRLLTHIKNYEMTLLPGNLGNIDHTELRVKYLMDEITEQTWKKTLKMRIKKNQKNHHIYQVYDLFCQVMIENLNVYLTTRDIDIFEDESIRIMGYTNYLIKNINEKFNSTNKKYFIKVFTS